MQVCISWCMARWTIVLHRMATANTGHHMQRCCNHTIIPQHHLSKQTPHHSQNQVLHHSCKRVVLHLDVHAPHLSHKQTPHHIQKQTPHHSQNQVLHHSRKWVVQHLDVQAPHLSHKHHTTYTTTTTPLAEPRAAPLMQMSGAAVGCANTTPHTEKNTKRLAKPSAAPLTEMSGAALGCASITPHTETNTTLLAEPSAAPLMQMSGAALVVQAPHLLQKQNHTTRRTKCFITHAKWVVQHLDLQSPPLLHKQMTCLVILMYLNPACQWQLLGKTCIFHARWSCIWQDSQKNNHRHGYKIIDKLLASWGLNPEEAFLITGKRRQWIEKKMHDNHSFRLHSSCKFAVVRLSTDIEKCSP